MCHRSKYDHVEFMQIPHCDDSHRYVSAVLLNSADVRLITVGAEARGRQVTMDAGDYAIVGPIGNPWRQKSTDIREGLLRKTSTVSPGYESGTSWRWTRSLTEL